MPQRVIMLSSRYSPSNPRKRGNVGPIEETRYSLALPLNKRTIPAVQQQEHPVRRTGCSFFSLSLYRIRQFNRSYSESFLPPSMKNWTVRAIPGFCSGDSFGACGGTFMKYFFFTITPLNAGVLPTAPMP